jgi:hypothetical protein
MKDCAIRKKIGYNQQGEAIYDSTGADDGRLSEIFGHKNGVEKVNQTAICFSPIPGDSSHVHKGTESNFIDWGQLYKSIDE